MTITAIDRGSNLKRTSEFVFHDLKVGTIYHWEYFYGEFNVLLGHGEFPKVDLYLPGTDSRFKQVRVEYPLN